MLREQAQDLKQEIQTLRKIPGVSKTELSHLETALDLLINPSSLHISAEESRFMQLLGKQHKVKDNDLADYQKLQTATVREAQSSVLKKLKNEAPNFSKLDKAARNATRGLKENVIKDRFERFVANHDLTPALSQNFGIHFPVLVNTFELFTHDVAEKGLQEKWSEVAALYDSASEGKFSKLLLHYSYMDPTSNFPSLIRECQENFFTSLDLPGIDKMQPGPLSPYLIGKVDTLKTQPAQIFENHYMGVYSQDHLWLLDNIGTIKQPYNQGDDIHENLGEGVCYSNSLDRMSKLIDNPSLSIDAIKMGSNPKTRYHQSRVGQYFTAAEKLALNFKKTAFSTESEKIAAAKEVQKAFKKAAAMEVKNAGAFGLKLYHHNELTPPAKKDPHEFLVEQVLSYGDAGHLNLMIGLYSLDGAHAVNIQLDPKKGIYRFMDDNLGLCEFSDREDFTKQLTAYFKNSYSEFVSLQIDVFQKA